MFAQEKWLVYDQNNISLHVRWLDSSFVTAFCTPQYSTLHCTLAFPECNETA